MVLPTMFVFLFVAKTTNLPRELRYNELASLPEGLLASTTVLESL